MHLTLTLVLSLDLAGTFVFALSGAMLAVRKRFDVVGVLVLSVAAGLGGGMLRDVLLGATPPAAIEHESYLLAALVAGLIGFFFHPRVARLGRSIGLLDALGLGFFAVSGTVRSLQFGLEPLSAILLGVVTGAGGGVIRDLLGGETPLVLRRDVYALAALLGAGVYVGATRLGLAGSPAAAAGVAVTVILRVLAMRYGWQAPRPRL
jgi:uncharacterized membrane protein YeiH